MMNEFHGLEVPSDLARARYRQCIWAITSRDKFDGEVLRISRDGVHFDSIDEAADDMVSRELDAVATDLRRARPSHCDLTLLSESDGRDPSPRVLHCDATAILIAFGAALANPGEKPTDALARIVRERPKEN